MVNPSQNNHEWLVLSPPIARLWAIEQMTATEDGRLWQRFRRNRSRGSEGSERTNGNDARP